MEDIIFVGLERIKSNREERGIRPKEKEERFGDKGKTFDRAG